MMHTDLSFAFAEQSKLASCPGQKHLDQAKLMLYYLAGILNHNHCITYSDPGEKRRNVLMSWVDSNFGAADLDTLCSVTGYVISMNNGLVLWKANLKQQGCVTQALSSAEAEFVAASQCRQEVLYPRHLLEHLWYEQREPTGMYKGKKHASKCRRIR
eukprot:1816196-Rhodomonas_salina.3